MFGKSLCGPDFNVRIEDFGYTFRPAPQPINNSQISNLTTPRTTSTKLTTSPNSKFSITKPSIEIHAILKSIFSH